MKKLQLILLFSLSSVLFFGQSPKREMRATWLATVWRIDWPGNVISSTGNAIEIASQKSGMIRILDSLASANMNAVCFQVRSRCDAMYQSSYEPWSTDLVASRGMNPGYDPLAFVIEEGHKRGIEVHAWLNPYRYESSVNQWNGPNDYRATNPDWLLTYASGASILDPGNPAVVKRIKSIVAEIVNNYDVDGIMFDDYFYAYGGTPATLDANTQALYKPADMSVGDWRRGNINKMVSAVYDTIQSLKSYVRFGVSPFGIWTTDQTVAAKEGLTLPGGISGANMYAEIYCDPVAWLKEGSVDYVSPQLYWGTGGSQDYGVLCPWWSKISNQFGKHFYSSQDLASLATSSYAPSMRSPKQNATIDIAGETVNVNNLTQIERQIFNASPAKVVSGGFSQEQIGIQIGINRSSDENNAPGSIFFSTKQLYTTTGFINYLKKFQFTQKSILPAIDWKKHNDYPLVSSLALNGRVLSWVAPAPNVRYVIYAIPNDKLSSVGNFNSSKYLLGQSYSPVFTIPAAVSVTANTFAVAVLDRYSNEFPPKVMGQALTNSAVVDLISPLNGDTKVMPFVFSWQANALAEFYILEVAEDAAFAKMICSREVNATSFSTMQLDVLQSDKTYFWRVKTRKPNAVDGVSEVRSFIPRRFSLLSPLAGATNVSLTPNISWLDVNSGSGYLVEISTSEQFLTGNLVYSKLVNATSVDIPTNILSGATVYYVRVSTDVFSAKVLTKVVNFTTLAVIPDTPVILSPVSGSSVSGSQIKVTWSEGITSGYRVEMSKDPLFPPRSTTIKSLAAFVYETTYTALAVGDYYLRVRASYSGTLNTDWSNVHKVSLTNLTGIDDSRLGDFKCTIRNSQSELTLDLNAPELTVATVSMYNLSGTEILQICNDRMLVAGSNFFTVQVGNLPKGVYLFSIKTSYGKRVLKYIL